MRDLVPVILNTVGGALLTVCIGASAWTVNQIIDLKSDQKATRALVDAYKAEGDRRFSEIGQRLDEINRKLDRLLEAKLAP